MTTGTIGELPIMISSSSVISAWPWNFVWTGIAFSSELPKLSFGSIVNDWRFPAMPWYVPSPDACVRNADGSEGETLNEKGLFWIGSYDGASDLVGFKMLVSPKKFTISFIPTHLVEQGTRWNCIYAGAWWWPKQTCCCISSEFAIFHNNLVRNHGS